MKESLFIDCTLAFRPSQNSLYFRGKNKAALIQGIIERLDANSISNKP